MKDSKGIQTRQNSPKLGWNGRLQKKEEKVHAPGSLLTRRTIGGGESVINTNFVKKGNRGKPSGNSEIEGQTSEGPRTEHFL